MLPRQLVNAIESTTKTISSYLTKRAAQSAAKKIQPPTIENILNPDVSISKQQKKAINEVAAVTGAALTSPFIIFNTIRSYLNYKEGQQQTKAGEENPNNEANIEAIELNLKMPSM